MNKIESAIVIDDNDINNFITQMMLASYGVTTIITFECAVNALTYLKKTEIKYQLILIDIYMPTIDGFEFIEMFYELKLNKHHGEICLLSASLALLHKKKAEEMKIKFFDKPLTIENLNCLEECETTKCYE
ncbi:MAG: hypothetical protein A3F72_08170 [Bacteroidetes bacterium RIFCSPLOWO2_12_FULL_35_15]|nr:MAG: hypothetical protein A3F72_08170 [Bacteroidetes bacterium RIFCSPLOWO2_12_FULL_35_15]